ncbi:uncharacterized protein BDW43DRAFT_299568 [Aspergillus alliaceus]|uniref:uncharacterized protein n=1 Tax=Petromyces alliaceus TaxID=209559 RepID=UPI0012A4AE59|nr:uncharacterized protein BDW43DRAFT_299568 [Aspergillus alliaceus]KAB8234511.1 hypothetical protein BDW43DRAFT_299568 [Aspergillus alliaceus]
MQFLRRGAFAASLSIIGCAAVKNSTYDYIVVGGGPSAGKDDLLLERGVSPTVSTGANETMSWNHILTPIGVPGLSADIANFDLWNQYICTDTGGTAACVLGDGVTVNYMVFVHSPEHDFNDKWPMGWEWEDVKSAAKRLYERNSGIIQPSPDGKRYDQDLYKTLSGFFDKLGWKSADVIAAPNEKYQDYSYPAWNTKSQMRAGPVRTYLPLAKYLDNFTLRLHTKVNRLVRSGSQVMGVEVIDSIPGHSGVIGLAPHGRVVLAAGALSTPRLLFNSGIGPKAHIETAKKSGITVPPQEEWINLPVGVGIKDHPIFPSSTDISLYNQKSGPLTQGKRRMIFFTSNKINVLGLDEKGNMVMQLSPYLQTADDRTAARTFIDQMVFKLETYKNTSAILNSLIVGIHYTTSAKMGIDDGCKNGTLVVDTNTKVYGIETLYVVDGSIHPDLPTGNIQATIMVVAEQAAAKILAQH